MKSPQETYPFPISIPHYLFKELSEYMHQTSDAFDVSAFASHAIEDWLAIVKRRPARGSSRPSRNGYQWKQLFLPSGTRLRTVFNGRNYHATVEGDRIVFDGREVSPSEFVNAVGGVGRNAWKSLWLSFPHENAWRLASSLRKATAADLA